MLLKRATHETRRCSEYLRHGGNHNNLKHNYKPTLFYRATHCGVALRQCLSQVRVLPKWLQQRIMETMPHDRIAQGLVFWCQTSQ